MERKSPSHLDLDDRDHPRLGTSARRRKDQLISTNGSDRTVPYLSRCNPRDEYNQTGNELSGEDALETQRSRLDLWFHQTSRISMPRTTRKD